MYVVKVASVVTPGRWIVVGKPFNFRVFAANMAADYEYLTGYVARVVETVMKTFDLHCEELPSYDQQAIPCDLDAPYDIVVAKDGTFLVKVGRYLSSGDKYRYRVATVRLRNGTVLS